MANLSRLLKDKSITLLDIRAPAEIAESSFEEFKGDHKLVYSVATLDDTSSLTDELLSSNGINKAEPIVVFCRSGRRAGVAVTALEALGCTNVYNGGGLTDMIAAAVSSPAASSESKLIFRQLFESESSTYTYLLACGDTREAILIDPVDLKVERDIKLIQELDLKLVAMLNTHCHADHITGTGLMKQTPGGAEAKSYISRLSGAEADVKFDHNDVIRFGRRSVIAKATPGHTAGCTCFVLDDSSMVFTGDAVLIRGCGRTDFQGGDAGELWEGIHREIFTLNDDCILYPGHDYKGFTSSTVGEEKKLNPRLTKSKEDFIDLMANLGLSYPKKIDVALPANLKDGIPEPTEAEAKGATE